MAGYKKYSKRAAADTDDDVPQKRAKSSKADKGKAPSAKKGSSDAEEPIWKLSEKRRVTISEYRGSNLIGIREYYEKDGDWKPGQKGISLSVEQYQALVKIIPAINAALLEKGVKIEGLGSNEDHETETQDNGDDDEAEVKGDGEETEDED